MKKILDHIKIALIFVLATTILLSVSGVKLYFHQCSISGKYVSMFSFPWIPKDFLHLDFDCHCHNQFNKIQACSSGCCSNITVVNEPESCCIGGEKVLLIDLKYTVETVKIVDTPKFIQLFEMSNIPSLSYFRDEIDENYTLYNPPPIVNNYRKFILVAHKQLKIPLA